RARHEAAAVLCEERLDHAHIVHALTLLIVTIRSTVIQARGLRFDALTAGPAKGEVVILLHGFPQNASCWREALASLGAAGYRAVAYSQRGYSAGAMLEGIEAYRLDEVLADLFAVADSLGAARFHLAGHDWGGVVAWSAAADAP